MYDPKTNAFCLDLDKGTAAHISKLDPGIIYLRSKCTKGLGALPNLDRHTMQLPMSINPRPHKC